MAYTIPFNDEIKKELQQRLAAQRDKKIYRRLLCLDLLSQGYSHQEVCAILGISSYSVTHWIKLFRQGGFERLCHLNYHRRRVSKLSAYTDAIRDKIQGSSVTTLQALQHWLAAEFGVLVSQSWLSRWLKKTRLFLQKDPISSRQCPFAGDSTGVYYPDFGASD